MMYVFKMHSYQGWYGIDINPVRMPVQTAIKINIDAIQSSIDRINDLDHESIIYAANNPEKARGWIDQYLIRARAKYPERLHPMPPVK
jgi:xylose isomerase